MKLFQRMFTAASLFLFGGAAATLSTDARADSSHQHVREIEVIVQGGYKPNRIEVIAGEHLQLKFVRRESADCTREVVFPALGIRKELPEGQPVMIHLPRLEPGEYEIRCGMDMIQGKLIVRAAG